jgi:hypothetical protein
MNGKPMDYWSFFARDAQKSGAILYGRIIEGVGSDDALKTMAGRARPGQPHANMILGAVNFLLLRGAQHELRRFYATLGGEADAGIEDPFPAFRDFCLAHRAEIEALIAARVTNTNEVGRSAVLHPGFRVVATESGTPLNLIEIGPSAGLNMIWDSYGVRYTRDGATVAEIAPGAPLVIEAGLRGEKRPPTGRTPAVNRRIGLELNPVDLTNADDRDWLRALIWPDQVLRLERLGRAMTLFDDVRPEIRTGDALALLPDAMAAMPESEPVCVYHTIVTYQFSHAMRESLNDMLTVAGLRRPVWRLALEAEAKDGDWRNWLTLTRYHDGTQERRLLAESHPHGTWLEWLV